MQKWEYLIAYFQGGKVGRVNRQQLPEKKWILDFVEQAGEEGWELIAAFYLLASDGHYIFKRPKS